MPIKPDFLKYHISIAKDLQVMKDCVRNLIGDSHWVTDGEHKEAILRRALRIQLPDSVRVGRGFIIGPQDNSTQIDVLISQANKPTLFRDGDLVFVTPDAVRAVVEVKTSIDGLKDLKNILQTIGRSVRLTRDRQFRLGDTFAGLFAFEPLSSTVGNEDILEALENAALEVDSAHPLHTRVNWVALGPDRFFGLWDSAWHAQSTPGLAHASFISRLVWAIGGDELFGEKGPWLLQQPDVASRPLT